MGLPIVMPSANRFKKLSPINAKMVSEQFGDTNLFIIDGGQMQYWIRINPNKNYKQ
jgi:tRNA A37 threonylcarbamoyladenosine synthetase subunit TsaC/SUA5/YrdC